MAREEHPFGYIENNDVYLKGFLNHPDRKIGEVKESPEKSIQYFEDRYATFSGKLDQLVESVKQSNNKGSFLMKIQHMIDQLGVYNGLGDFVLLYNRLKALEESITDDIEGNRKKNKELKETLIQELEAFAEAKNWSMDKDKVKDIQQRWIRIGKVDDDIQDEFEERYKELTSEFFESYKDHLDAQKELHEIRRYKYEEVLRKANKLIKDSNPKDSDKFKDLQKEWKDIGFVPKPVFTPLLEQFKELGNTFFANIKKKATKKKEIPYDQINNARLDLTNHALSLYELSYSDLADSLKELKDKWRSYKNEVGKFTLSKDFFIALQYGEEYVFVYNLTKRLTEGFSEKSSQERGKIFFNVLVKQIEKEKTDIFSYEDNKSQFSIGNNSNFSKMVDNELETKKRKLKAKEQILENITQ